MELDVRLCVCLTTEEWEGCRDGMHKGVEERGERVGERRRDGGVAG